MTVRQLPSQLQEKFKWFCGTVFSKTENYSGTGAGRFAWLLFLQRVSSFFDAVSLPIIHWFEKGRFFPISQNISRVRRHAIWQSDSCHLIQKTKKSPRSYYGTSDFHKYIISCQEGDIKCYLDEKWGLSWIPQNHFHRVFAAGFWSIHTSCDTIS